MKLTEQELSWDDAVNVISKPKPPVAPTSPKGGRGNDDLTSKNDGPKDDTAVNKSSDVDADKLSKLNTYFLSSFETALKFLYKIGPATQNSDTDKTLETLKSYLRGKYIKSKAMYADWLIRLSNPASTPGQLAQKYRKQYDYVFTRNGKAGSNTVQTIQSIPKSPTLKDLNSFFDPGNPIGEDLDIVNNTSLRRDWVNNDIIEYRDGNTKSQLVSGVRRDAYAFHKDIMNFYAKGTEGLPIAKYRTKF